MFAAITHDDAPRREIDAESVERWMKEGDDVGAWDKTVDSVAAQRVGRGRPHVRCVTVGELNDRAGERMSRHAVRDDTADRRLCAKRRWRKEQHREDETSLLTQHVKMEDW